MYQTHPYHRHPAVERLCNTQDRPGQILASRLKSLQPCKLLPLGPSEGSGLGEEQVQIGRANLI